MPGHMFSRIKYFLKSSQMFLSSLMHLLVVLTKGIMTLPAISQKFLFFMIRFDELKLEMFEVPVLSHLGIARATWASGTAGRNWSTGEKLCTCQMR